MRHLVDSPRFWYLDGDTTLRGPLPPSLNGGACLAACEDWTRNLYYFAKPTCARAGWELDVRHPYINGGVMFWNDAAEAFRLAERWHELWRHGLEVAGISSDQPSLNVALQQTNGADLLLLSRAFNRQLWIEPWAFRDAVVWHFGGEAISVSRTGENRPKSLYEAALDSEQTQAIRRAAEQCAAAPSPWVATPEAQRSARRLGPLAAQHAGSFVGQAYGAIDHGDFGHAGRLLADAIALGWHSPSLLVKVARCAAVGGLRFTTNYRRPTAE